jgi:hypothetical protein
MQDEVYDTDAVMRVLLPWRLKIKCGGKLLATRQPSVGQMMALQELTKVADGGNDAMKIVLQLFEKPDEAQNAMNLSAFQLAARKIVSHAVELAGKNSPFVAAAMLGEAAGSAAANGTATGGPSSPPSSTAAPPSAL